MNDIPYSSELNIGALIRLFKNKTNSYKYIFFLALLEVLRSENFNASKSIAFRKLATEMLVTAWYPHTFFKLSFGIQDQIAIELDRLALPKLSFSPFNNIEQRKIQNMVGEKISDDLVYRLLRYVPFRLLRVFFEEETRGLSDFQVNSKIRELSLEFFDNRKPLYRILEGDTCIEVHPVWTQYFSKNYSIIRSWVFWEWAQYMQKCNPNVPAIIKKLYPPSGRSNLQRQREYWKLVISRAGLRCIYSGKSLLSSEFTLDHFLPWTFVVHDQLWNLIPIDLDANLSKWDRLPSNKYFHDFVSVQHTGIIVTHKYLDKEKWLKFTESYIGDLNISDEKMLLDREKLFDAYKNTIQPLLILAGRQGFVKNWIYRP